MVRCSRWPAGVALLWILLFLPWPVISLVSCGQLSSQISVPASGQSIKAGGDVINRQEVHNEPANQIGNRPLSLAMVLGFVGIVGLVGSVAWLIRRHAQPDPKCVSTLVGATQVSIDPPGSPGHVE